MAFPTIPTVAAGRVLSTNQLNTTATRTFPDLSSLTKNSGDLLIAIVVGYQSSLTSAIFSSWGASFTEFHDSGGTSEMCVGMAYKWSDGTETGTFTVTQGGTVTGDASLFLLSIPGAHASTPPEAGSRAVGTASAANPAAFNPTGWDAEDTLWISLVGSGMTSGTGSWTATGTTAPTNYTDRVDTNASDTSTTGDCEAAVSFRQVNAASEDVGTAGVDTSNARNVAVVIAVRPAPAATTLDAGSNTVTVSAPDVPAVNLTIPQTANTVTVTAPTASLPLPALEAGTNTITVTAPSIPAVALTIPVTANTITLSVPTVVLGVGTYNRTNYATQSEVFEDAVWDAVFASITANVVANPNNGLTDADLLTEDTSASGNHLLARYSTSGLDDKEYYNFSIYVKPNGREWILLQMSDYGTTFYMIQAEFHLSGAGSYSVTGGDNGPGQHGFSIEQKSNGWYRISGGGYLRHAGSQDISIELYLGTASNTYTYTGNGTSGAYFWGAQLEQGGNATTYAKATTTAIQNTLLTFGGVTVTSTAPTAVLDQNLLSAEANTITVSAPEETLLAETTVQAGQNTINLTAPDAGIDAPAGSTNLAAGQNTVTITAPTVPAVSLTLPQTANVITLSAPEETLLAEVTLAAGQNTITLSAPEETLLAEAALPAGQNTITVSAPEETLLAETALAAGQNTITLSAPTIPSLALTMPQAVNTVTLTAPTAEAVAEGGPVTRQAGENTVTITAPTVPAAHLSMPVSANTVTWSAPTSQLIAEVSLSSGTQTVTVEAPSVSMIVDQLLSTQTSLVTVSAPEPLLGVSVPALSNIIVVSAPNAALAVSVDVELSASANSVLVRVPIVTMRQNFGGRYVQLQDVLLTTSTGLKSQLALKPKHEARFTKYRENKAELAVKAKHEARLDR